MKENKDTNEEMSGITVDGVHIAIEQCGGVMPGKAHVSDAAFDVYSSEDVKLEPYSRCTVPLGFRMRLPDNYCADILPRSGMSVQGLPVDVFIEGLGTRKMYLDADVLHGLIDSGYRGVVNAIVRVGEGVTLWPSKLRITECVLRKGTKLAQMRINRIPNVNLYSSVIDDDTDRGTTGFGDSGENCSSSEDTAGDE